MEGEVLQPKKSGLSVTSFVLSVLGLFLCMTIIGVLIGIPLAFLGLIFGIFALAYKQKKGLAITGVIIGGLITLFTVTVLALGAIFINNNQDVLLDPMKDFTQRMKNDPQIALTMKDVRFQKDFEQEFKANLSGKINDDKLETRSDIREALPIMYEEMVNTVLQLKDKYAAGGFQLGTGVLIETGTIGTGIVDLPKIEAQTGTTQTGTAQPVDQKLTACKIDADCIPLPSECHPMSCINKTYEANYKKPEMCTMMFAVEAAYSAKDCACQKNVCVNKNLGKK